MKQAKIVLFFISNLCIGTVFCSQGVFPTISLLLEGGARGCWEKQSTEKVAIVVNNKYYSPYRPIRAINSFFAGCWAVYEFPFSIKKARSAESLIYSFGYDHGKMAAESQMLPYISTVTLTLIGLGVLRLILH
jgi:hypothetical protein